MDKKDSFGKVQNYISYPFPDDPLIRFTLMPASETDVLVDLMVFSSCLPDIEEV